MDSITDLVEEIERSALDIAKKGGAHQNEEDEFDNRGMVEILLKAKKTPSKVDCNKIAFDMLDWYTSQELTHNHNSKGEIVVKTINQVWARKGISTLSTKIEGAWAKLHKDEVQEEEVTKESAPSGRRKEGSFKERMLDNGKRAVTKALVRKASRNLTDLSQQAVVSLLMTGAKTEDPTLRTQIAQIMGTDIGKAVCAGLLSIALDQLPIPGLSQENRDALVSELQIDAVDQVTMPLENIAKMALPMLTGALTPLLTGGSSEPQQIPQATTSQPGSAAPVAEPVS